MLKKKTKKTWACYNLLPLVLRSCQVGSVFARQPLLIRPSVLDSPGRGCCRGIIQGPLGEGERRPTLSSSRRLCPRVQGRRRPQLEVSGQQTHTNVCVEGQRATSPSVPPRCLLSSALTSSCSCSPLRTRRYDASSPSASRFMRRFSFSFLTSGCLGTRFVRGRRSLMCLFDVGLIVQPPRSV